MTAQGEERARKTGSSNFMEKSKDVGVAIGVVVIGVVFLTSALMLPPGSIRAPIGPSGIPAAVGILLVIGGVALALRRVISWHRTPATVPNEGSADLERYPSSFIRVVLIWAVCLVYAILLPWVGFVLLTPVLIAALLWILSFRRIRDVVIIAISATVVMYVLFDILLAVRLPHGPLTGVI